MTRNCFNWSGHAPLKWGSWSMSVHNKKMAFAFFSLLLSSWHFSQGYNILWSSETHEKLAVNELFIQFTQITQYLFLLLLQQATESCIQCKSIHSGSKFISTQHLSQGLQQLQQCTNHKIPWHYIYSTWTEWFSPCQLCQMLISVEAEQTVNDVSLNKCILSYVP